MQNKERIALAFEEMMDGAFLDDITVSDIMHRCHLSRTAFYRYYKDKYDLMAYVYLHAIERRLESSQEKDWRGSILICYRYIYEKGNFFRRVVKYRGQNNFLLFLYEYSYNCIASSLCAAKRTEALDERGECSVRMYCSACTYLVKWWLTNGLKLRPEELYEIALENIPVCLQEDLADLKLVLHKHEAL